MNTMNTFKNALYTDDESARKLTPAETIAEMFASTDENGVLYIPAWPTDRHPEGNGIYRCVMDWDRQDAEELTCEFESLRSSLARLAAIPGAAFGDVRSIDIPADLENVWHTYIRGFETGDIDLDQVSDISDRLQTMDLIGEIRGRMQAGEELSEDDRSFFKDLKDVTVSEEEKALYSEYMARLEADAARRIGDSFAAYSVVIRAKRLCRLMELKAPEIIIGSEACLLAQAMAVHRYAKSVTVQKSMEA